MTTIKQDTIIRYYYKYETFKALLKNNNRNTKYKIKKLFWPIILPPISKWVS